MLGDKVGAVGKDRGECDLDTRVVEPSGELADDVAQPEAEGSTAESDHEEMADAFDDVGLAREDSREEDLEDKEMKEILFFMLV